jgi:hypothetical protein
MDRTDGIQKFSAHISLQYVTPRASFQSPYNLDVACVRRQHDASVGEFASNASSFGQSTQMRGASLGSGGQNGGLNPLYQIGGPRSAQLALKLLF